MKELKRTGECSKCGACCQGFRITVPRVISRDHIKYYKLHNVDVELKKGETVLKIKSKCKAFDPETKLCKLYGKDRPIVCMKYPTSEDADKLHPTCTFKFVEGD